MCEVPNTMGDKNRCSTLLISLSLVEEQEYGWYHSGQSFLLTSGGEAQGDGCSTGQVKVGMLKVIL